MNEKSRREVHLLLLLLLLGRIAALPDATYCHRWSSVVCRSVGLSVDGSITIVSSAKTAELIEMSSWASIGMDNY